MARKIADFGEKIGGARKDLWRKRGLLTDDISGFNTTELVEHVNKKNIWLEPKWKRLINEGYEPEALYIIKYIRDVILSKPKITESTISYYLKNYGEDKANEILIDECAKYITAIIMLRDTVMTLKQANSLPKVLVQAKAQFKELPKDSEYRNIMQEADLLTDLPRYYKNLVFEAQVQGFPDNFRGDLRGLSLYQSSSKQDTVYVLLSKSNKLRPQLSKKLPATFSTEEEAKEYCLSGKLVEYLDKNKKTKKASTLVQVVRPQLEHIERYAPNLRSNKAVTGDDILNDFGFRGGEFGNWNTDDDRQACLNYIYDAMKDLAFCMNVTPKFIGMEIKPIE